LPETKEALHIMADFFDRQLKTSFKRTGI
jgi:hypothetical protein